KLFRPQYTTTKIATGPRRIFRVVGVPWIRGSIPSSGKTCAAHQHEIAGALVLKSARYHSGRRLAIQKEMTNPSSATVTVPAALPKSRTAAKTNVSETEIEAGTEGS